MTDEAHLMDAAKVTLAGTFIHITADRMAASFDVGG